MSLRELALRSGKHSSQLSRIERPEARLGLPKRTTIFEILDALEATVTERWAVFHIDQPELSTQEIEAQRSETAAEYGTSRSPVILLGEHWHRWYMNPAALTLLGYSTKEYEDSMGDHALLHVIDPACPMYSRYPSELRRQIFSWRAASFRFHFADQQFDRWYLRIAEEIGRFYWAEQIWLSPPDLPEFPDNQTMPILNPEVGLITMRAQLNQMLKSPRFYLMELTPADEETAQKQEQLYRSAGLVTE